MYQISGLSEFPKLFHAFSTKVDGNMTASILGEKLDYKKVINNRTKFLSSVGIDINHCVYISVVHGNDIVTPSLKSIGTSILDYKKSLKVDGLVTNKKGVFLFLPIADCLPIIFYDLKKKVVSLVHAGWKGVDLEIARKAVDKMQVDYGSNPVDLVVGIGPHARKESFIKENPTQKDNSRWKLFIKNVGDNRYEVDLLGFTKKQLVNAGVLKRNIFISDVDTVKDERFFSHVREKSLPIERQGRFACIVGMI